MNFDSNAERRVQTHTPAIGNLNFPSTKIEDPETALSSLGCWPFARIGDSSTELPEFSPILAQTGSVMRQSETVEHSLFSVVTQSYLLILQGIASISCLILSFLFGSPKWSPSKVAQIGLPRFASNRHGSDLPADLVRS
jgi:hypothetical protein